MKKKKKIATHQQQHEQQHIEIECSINELRVYWIKFSCLLFADRAECVGINSRKRSHYERWENLFCAAVLFLITSAISSLFSYISETNIYRWYGSEIAYNIEREGNSLNIQRKSESKARKRFCVKKKIKFKWIITNKLCLPFDKSF